MSNSIGPSAPFTAFGHRINSVVLTPSPASVDEMERCAAMERGALECSPWEALYLEQARPVVAEEAVATGGQQLGSFLTTLMYGE